MPRVETLNIPKNSDNGFTRDSYLPWITTGHLSVPSNVTRIVRALKPLGNGRCEERIRLILSRFALDI